MNLFSQTLRNLTVGWASKLLVSLAALLIPPLMLDRYGVTGYGLWVAILQISLFLSILDLGATNSLSRLLARYSQSDRDADKTAVTSSCAAVIGGGMALGALSLAAICAFVEVIFPSEDYPRDVKTLLSLTLGGSQVLRFPLRLYRGFFESSYRFEVVATFDGAGAVLRVLAVILGATVFNLDLVGLALAYVATEIGVEILAFLKMWRQAPFRLFDWTTVRLGSLREVMSFGLSSLSQSLSLQLYTRGIVLLISIRYGVEHVLLFTLPLAIVTNLGQVVSQLGTMLVPLAAMLTGAGDDAAIRRTAIFGIHYGYIIAIPLTVFLFFYADPLLLLWLGGDNLTETDFALMTSCLQVMLAAFLIGWPQIASRSVLMGIGHHWVVANILLTSSLAGFAIAAIGIYALGAGVLAAAVGWAAKVIIGDASLIPARAAKALGMRLGRFIRETSGRAGLLLSVILGAAVASRVAFPSELVGAIFFWLVAPVSCLFAIHASHRRSLAQQVIRLARRRRSDLNY